MHPEKEKRIFETITKYTLLSDLQYGDFSIDTDILEKTMEEFTTVMARNDMGGNEGIHKPTSGNPDRLRR